MIRIYFIMSISIMLSTSTLLSGCAPTSTGPLVVGRDTYTISATGPDDNFSEAKKVVYTEASEECKKQGKEVLVISERTFRYSTIDLTFKCLHKDDPEIQKTPANVKEAGILIEDQSK